MSIDSESSQVDYAGMAGILIRIDVFIDSELNNQLKPNVQTTYIPVLLFAALKILPTIAEKCRVKNYNYKPFDIEEFRANHKAPLV